MKGDAENRRDRWTAMISMLDVNLSSHRGISLHPRFILNTRDASTGTSVEKPWRQWSPVATTSVPTRLSPSCPPLSPADLFGDLRRFRPLSHSLLDLLRPASVALEAVSRAGRPPPRILSLLPPRKEMVSVFSPDFLLPYTVITFYSRLSFALLFDVFEGCIRVFQDRTIIYWFESFFVSFWDRSHQRCLLFFFLDMIDWWFDFYWILREVKKKISRYYRSWFFFFPSCNWLNLLVIKDCEIRPLCWYMFQELPNAWWKWSLLVFWNINYFNNDDLMVNAAIFFNSLLGTHFFQGCLKAGRSEVILQE